MPIFFTTLLKRPYIESPNGLLGWILWIGFVVLIGWLVYHWRRFNKPWGQKQGLLFIALVLFVPLTSLFFGIQFPSRGALPPPDLPVDPLGELAMVFSATPWMIAGGLLGPLPALILAVLAGVIQALWGSHNPFTILEIALLGVLFSAAMSQRYRTIIYQLLRQPLATAFLFTLLYQILFLTTTPATVNGSNAIRLDYAFSQLPGAWLAIGTELLVGGIITQIVAMTFPALWGAHGALLPSPPEKSLQLRLIYSFTPLFILLLIALIIGDWVVATAVARDNLGEQLKTTARSAALDIPYYLDNGQSFISQLASQLAADPRLKSASPGQFEPLLAGLIKSGPFFDQLVLLNDRGETVAAYPHDQFTGDQIPIQEQVGLQLALANLPVQTFTIPPVLGGSAAQASFVASIIDDQGKNQGVLIGRSNLASNPLTESLVSNLANLSEFNGKGILLDEGGQILIHPDPSLVMEDYSGKTSEGPLLFDETSPDGTRSLVYYQPVQGRDWAIVLSLPAQRIQQVALQMTIPLLAIVVALSILALLLLRTGIRLITNSLENLATEANDIARGELDTPLPVEGEDEVGQLRQAFEEMRISLKARLDELNQLLVVSQGISSSLEMGEAVQPVLESALSTGACSARIVLLHSIVPELVGTSAQPIVFRHGPAKDLYSKLDDQVLTLTQQQDRLVLNETTHPRILKLSTSQARPTSLIAIALRYENQYFGALWLAYDQPHTFSEAEIRFLSTLASQTAVAVSTSRAFMNAEISRQRLAGILASNPDPILVTDQHNQLILANAAALDVLGLQIDTEMEYPIERVITNKDLLELLRDSNAEKQSVEITLDKGHIYLGAVSTLVADGQRIGRVCVLRDITRFKELDTLKSEFVSTVSHDLRTPLSLVRGYATMLEMVGQLNEQQTGYVQKIVGGVDSMSHLVNNLLDLGRVEAGVGLQLEMVSASEIADRAVANQRLQANQKKIQLRTEYPGGKDLTLEADSALLQQAINNLVDNAIKFTRNEGSVTLRVDAQPMRMLFEVRDTGIGIAPMDQPHLFEKFYRGPQLAASERSGSGLGLAIVRSIAERHHGQVWVDSQFGKGSTFYLAIPIRQSARKNGGDNK